MQNPASTSPTPERLMQFAFGYAPPLIIGAAVQNKVFDTLSHGAKTVDEVSRATGASTRGLRAAMNALVGLQLLTKQNDRYGLTRESETFLVSGTPASLAGFFGMLDTHMIPDWLQTNAAVKSGRPSILLNQEKHGPEFFSVLVENIIPMSYAAAMQLADSLDVVNATAPVRVLDVAAGSGIWGIMLAKKSKHVQVTAQDWSDMIPVTKRVAEKFGVADQFSYCGGDVLDAQFGSGFNIATLGHILHTEGAERSRKLLKRVADALKSGATIVIAEFLVNDERTEPPQSLLFAVNMLVHTEHGDTFSFNEIKDWLEAAGFKDVRTLDAPGPSPLILATKI